MAGESFPVVVHAGLTDPNRSRLAQRSHDQVDGGTGGVRDEHAARTRGYEFVVAIKSREEEEKCCTEEMPAKSAASKEKAIEIASRSAEH